MQCKLYNKFIVLFLLNVSFAFSQFENTASQLKIKLIPVFNGEKFVLHDKEFVTKQNDTIKITNFKMYLSNINLIHNSLNDSLRYQNNFLIDADDTTTFILNVKNILPSTYNLLEFLIGVDSLTNVSGALDGDLDPIKGMYWAWNTGYVSAKLEGIFKHNGLFTKKFEFHIGGYQKPFESFRKITVPIPELKLAVNDILLLECYIELSNWFYGDYSIRLAEINTILHPCKESFYIATNYSKLINFKSSKIIK